MELEEVNCPLCDSRDCKKIFSAKDINSGIKGRFSYVKCSKCSLVFMNPRPKKKFIPLLYPKDYYAYSERPSDQRHSFNSFIYRKKQEILNLFSQEGFSLKKIINYPFYLLLKEFDHTFIPLKQKGSILDVGCGTGTYLLGWRAQGWNVAGIELNKSVAEYARKKFGLNILGGTLEECKLNKESFDVITMFHLIEHEAKPKNTVIKARQLLKSKGLIIIVTPNFSSLESKIFGSEWFNIDAPRHYCLFDGITLKKLLEENGFKAEKIKYNVMPNSLLHCIDSYFERKRIPLRVNNSFSAFLMIPLYLIFSFFRVGGIIAVYARK